MIYGIKRNVVLAVLTTSIVACSSSPFNEQSRLPMEGYEEQVYAACMQSNTVRHTDTDKKQISCRGDARYSMELFQQKFDRTQRNALLDKCINDVAFNQCAHEFQKPFYDNMVKAFIRKQYPRVIEK